MSCTRTGSQEPRILIEPQRASTDGDDAVWLAEACGLKLDEWQRLVVVSWLGRDEADKWASISCGLSVPRQNGKNAILEAVEIYCLAVLGEKILHTAHRVDTARKSFLRLVKYFEGPAANPDLAEMVTCIRKTNGQESITLSNGGSIEFSSRVNGGARGSTYDRVIFDEAQELTDDQMEAIMSTMAASPSGNRQLLFTGTPPSPVSPGTVFRGKRDTALEGNDKRCSWHEWSVAEIGDVADKERWYQTNPGMGIRLDEDFTEAELNTLSKEGFARERLGWWSDDEGGNPALSKTKWEECYTPNPSKPSDRDKIAYGVKFAPDGRGFAISAAVKSPDGTVLIECIEAGELAKGVGPIADFCIARSNKCALLVIDGKSNTAALERKLLDGGFPKRAYRIASPSDVCAAASMLKDALDEGAVAHAGQPGLTDSAVAAQKRDIGKDGGWGFGDGKRPCAPIESASLAHWGVRTTKRNPARKMRCG